MYNNEIAIYLTPNIKQLLFDYLEILFFLLAL